VHVVYGLVGLKTHSKIVLVVRREEDGLRRYCHIGTGNYNSETARIYEDLGLLTADPAIGEDLTDLFNHLTRLRPAGHPPPHRGGSPRHEGMGFSPDGRRSGVGEAGRITIKVHGLTDPEVIDVCTPPRRRAVRIDLVVRGVCCLGQVCRELSDRITVRSIMGRYLEHSRIFRFGDPSGDRQVRYTIGSGDLMSGTWTAGSSTSSRFSTRSYGFDSRETLQLNLARRHQRLGARTGWRLRCESCRCSASARSGGSGARSRGVPASAARPSRKAERHPAV